MGWTSYRATHYWHDGHTVNRKAELDEELFRFEQDGGYKLLKSALVGSTYYAAVKRPDGTVYALVVLTAVDNKEWCNFSYKDMTESMGPGAADCPASILKLLSPTDDEYALDWRKRCRDKVEEKGSPTALANLPVGAKIRITWNGRTEELVKHAPAYQFKRPFWYLPARNTYISKKRIPKDYEVIPG